MYKNPFVLETNEYKREIDPLNQYLEQSAKYLVITKGIEYGCALDFVKRVLKDGSFPKANNPNVTYLERQENGDREKKTTKLSAYIYSSLRNEELIAPTLTTYINPKIKPSLLVQYIDKNISKRSAAKKQMFKAIASGEKEIAQFMNQQQNNMKTKNNSLSGAQATGGTPISNKTAHSTLTSNCRSTSGYGNANNEKLLAGNRHYWSSDIVLNNIVSIVTNTDYDALNKTMTKYEMHVPTVLEVMECITRSTDLYWRNKIGMSAIERLVLSLTDEQRSSFLYTGDLYHIAKYNHKLVHNFITGLSTKVESDFENELEYVKASPGDVVHLARNLCHKEMVGKDEIYEKINGTQELKTLAATCKCINETIKMHSDFISTFFVTKNMPASVAYIPESVRRVALTSDTDSTIFTVYDWVNWYHGREFVTPGDPVAAAMIFIAAQSITHILAKMSANFGIAQERLYQIAMKNEYKFDVYVPTNVAKHYFATKNVQEGIILSPMDYEIKGVHLKNSNAPASINAEALKMMKDILHTVQAGEKIKLLDYLKRVANIEREVFSSITKGETTYLRLGQIKNPEAYSKEPMLSPYLYHNLWQTVFGPKYGTFEEPPYATVRLATTADSPTKLGEWLKNIKDEEFKERLKNWFITNNKKQLPSLMIPTAALVGKGMPEELMLVVDVRKIVFDITKTFYLVLETLGFYISNDNITKLISDHY